MGQIYKRMIDIKYQIIKTLKSDLTDEEKVLAVRSLYDSIINENTYIPVDTVFPTTLLGTDLEWSTDNTDMIIKLNDIYLEDSLSDNVIPSIDTYSNSLLVNGELFMVNDDTFEVAI